MFPLAGKSFPDSKETLAIAIHDALAEHLTRSDNGSSVTAEGGTFPIIKKLKVNLNGALVSASEPPPKPRPTGKRQPGVEVEQLEVTAKPLQYEQSKLNLDVKARGLQFQFGRDKSGRPLLVLTDAEEGHVELRIAKSDIESLMLAIARELGKQQNVNVYDIQLSLASSGPRSMMIDARISAKKMLVSGTIHVKGQVDVDDELTATVSDLDASGEGMVGTMISGIIDRKLKPYNGKKVPLMAFSLGDVALSDLRISVKNTVQVTASFGRKA